MPTSVCATSTSSWAENRIVYDLVDVVKGNARLKQALIKDRRSENLSCSPRPRPGEEGRHGRADEEPHGPAGTGFDFVLMDCPAGIEDGFKNAIAGAQKAIIVANPEVSSSRCRPRLGLWDAQEGDRSPAMLIVNRVRPRMSTRGDMLEIDDMLEMLAVVDLLGVVPEDDHIIVSTNRGEPAVYSVTARRARHSRTSPSRFMGEAVPILDLRRRTNRCGPGSKAHCGARPELEGGAWLAGSHFPGLRTRSLECGYRQGATAPGARPRPDQRISSSSRP